MIFSDVKGGAAPITGTVISGNRINSQENGVYVGTTAMSASLHFNDLSGNSVGVNNAGTGTIDAAWNYWGCPGGPTATGCAATNGDVGAASWLPAAPTSIP